VRSPDAVKRVLEILNRRPTTEGEAIQARADLEAVISETPEVRRRIVRPVRPRPAWKPAKGWFRIAKAARKRARRERARAGALTTAKAHGQVLYFDGRKIRWTRPGVPCPANGIEIRTPRQFDEVPRLVREALHR